MNHAGGNGYLEVASASGELLIVVVLPSQDERANKCGIVSPSQSIDLSLLFSVARELRGRKIGERVYQV